MKNIHLLKTEKPTGIFQSNSGLQFSIRDKVRVYPLIGFHTYITSDKEIKIGNWCIDKHNAVYKQETDKIFTEFTNSKKIILTTDEDLIADGVQAIDDGFLEWFVKNPSCESVETKVVDFEVDMGLGDECIEHGSYYKIIIPKEEPKQETLEEASERYATKQVDISMREDTLEFSKSGKELYQESKIDFIEGAKWQAENMPIHIIDVENIYVHIENGVIIVEKNKKK